MKKAVLFYAAWLLLGALLAAVAGLPSLFRLPPTPSLLGASCAAAVALALAVVQLGRALEEVALYRDMTVWVHRMVRLLAGGKLDASGAFLLASSSALGEEALFRGFIQPWLGALVGGRLLGRPDLAQGIGICLSTVLFGILHFPVVRELIPWTLFATALGFAFGGLAAWSDSLIAPVIAHFLINYLNLRHLETLPDPGPVPSDRPAAR